VSVRARTLATAGLVVTGAFFVSRLLGWLRTVVIAGQFGASPDLDAYFAAFRIPDAIFQLVAAGALSSALIPVLSGLVAHGEHARAWRVVSTVVNLMLVALIALSLVLAVAAPLIIPAITPGFDAQQMDLTVRLSRIMLLSPTLLALGAVATSVLNTMGRFGASAVAPIVYNVGIILGAILLAPFMGVEGLAIGVVVGSVGHLALQLPQIVGRMGFVYERRIDMTDPAAREALLLMVPRAIGLGASQITFLVNTTLASIAGAGAIVAYNVAFTVLQIPIGVIGVPLGIVLLPSLSRSLATGAVQDYGRLVLGSLRLLLYVTLFLTTVGMVLRREIVTLLFNYGRFDERAIDMTADTLLFFLGGLAAHSIIAILARAFYAGKDTRTPVMAALLSVAVNVVVSIATFGTLGLAGLALGIAVGAWVEATLLILLLRERTPGMGLDSLGRALATFLIGAVLAALAALAILRLSEPAVGPDPGKVTILIQSSAAFAAAAAVYLAYSRLLRIPELASTIGILRQVVTRRGVDAGR
jgi:putative peptidoglycan lipid II flippase